MLRFVAVLFLSALCFSNANANLCPEVRDLDISGDSVQEEQFYRELFGESDYHGSRQYNQIVLQCNRKRDNNGNEVRRELSVTGSNDIKQLLKSDNLEKKVIRGRYLFLGAFSFKYRYILAKQDGEWSMIIPYKAEINDVVSNRVDFYIGYRRADDLEKGTLRDTVKSNNHAWSMYEEDQTMTLADGSIELILDAKSIAETLCSTGTYFSGAEGKYAGKSGLNADKRDRANKHISLGRTQYRYKKRDYINEGCRVKDNKPLYWQDPNVIDPITGALSTKVTQIIPKEWIFDNFIRNAEKYWSGAENFKLRLLIKGYNEDQFEQNTLNMLEDGDYLTVRFATKFMQSGGNQMYKSNAIQFNNFSTMTTDDTILHEVGHAFGLDDEYGQSGDGEVDCENQQYADLPGRDPATYQMCVVEGDEYLNTIYHYIAVSRYGTKQRECREDNDCDQGEWCKNGVDLVLNQCLAKRNNGEECPLVGGGHACKSGHCKFAQCYTPDSVAPGAACFVNDQCAEGTCSNVVDGTNGICVCNDDSQCGDAQYCDVGLDFKLNACRSLKNDNEACSLVDGGRTCSSGYCNTGRCYTPNSVDMGGVCYINAACKDGKCSSVNGTRGTCVCDNDGDCGSSQYCDAGLDFRLNACRSLKNDNATCSLIDGGRTCKSGTCNTGRCYTANSVDMGDVCYVNAACKDGKCSSVNGTRGTCVCDSDGDCGSDKWCDMGLDLTINSCKFKLNKGAVCGIPGEIGVGHRCKSGKCKVIDLSGKLKCK